MKIMFYNDDISVLSGGAERVITNLATRFSEAGYDCVMLNHVKGDDEYPLSGDVRRIIIRPQGTRHGLIKKYDIVAGIRRAVKKERPEILVTFGRGMINRALFATIGLPVKNVISYRNAASDDLKSIKNYILSRTLHLRANGVVFQTEDARNSYPHRLQRIGAIISNQVEARFFNTKYEGVHRDVVTVGRLKVCKNHRLLIESFAKISDKIPDNLLLFGAGPEKDNLQSLVNRLGLTDRVFLNGNSNNVPDNIKSAKLFVLTSDNEGFPNAMIEAMALGLPCVSTDCLGGGARTLLSGVLAQWLVPIGDVDSLAEKMLMLLQDGELNGKVGRLCRLRAEDYRPEVIFEHWKLYIDNVAAGLNKYNKLTKDNSEL